MRIGSDEIVKSMYDSSEDMDDQYTATRFELYATVNWIDL